MNSDKFSKRFNLIADASPIVNTAVFAALSPALGLVTAVSGVFLHSKMRPLKAMPRSNMLPPAVRSGIETQNRRHNRRIGFVRGGVFAGYLLGTVVCGQMNQYSNHWGVYNKAAWKWVVSTAVKVLQHGL